MHKTLHQLWRYGLFASAGLALDYGTLIFLKEVVGLYYLLAVCGGFIVGLIATYILSNKYVFGQPKGSHRLIFTLFGIIGIGGLAILSFLVWLLTGQLGINYVISKTIATLFVFLWNFFVRRKLFNHEDLPKTF
jgi:putative flippase GtrA